LQRTDLRSPDELRPKCVEAYKNSAAALEELQFLGQGCAGGKDCPLKSGPIFNRH